VTTRPLDADTVQRLRVRLPEPFNAGPPLAELGRHAITPVDLFYVRNHGDVPVVDADTYRLTVDGMVTRPLTLGLRDLAERFERRTIVATVQCAGNRRAGLSALAPTRSPLQWEADAIGTAEWSGFELHDVLAAAGVEPTAEHVAFLGGDTCQPSDGPVTAFGGSVPIEVARSGRVLLADRMNGAPLTRMHGAPLRAVVHGYIGARSVKWLTRITVQDRPSDNWYQQRDYRMRIHDGDRSGPGDGTMLGEVATTSAITEPAAGDRLTGPRITIRGYAIAAHGRDIARVEVSSDGGASWQPARMHGGPPGAWRLWQVGLDVEDGVHEFVVRAWDDAGEGQPADVAEVWNPDGYGNTAWDRVTVLVGR
jgi:sulfite oxidase